MENQKNTQNQLFIYSLKISKDRIAVLIGKKGNIKKQIEEETHTKLKIDSKEGIVIIKGDDGLNIFTAKEIVRAIGRGFNPEYALELLKPNYLFEKIDITDYTGKNKNSLIRIRSRLIGSEGKARKTLEKLTDTHIVIYGKTVGIIGENEDVLNAKRAIEQLIKGAPHKNIYSFLEKRRKNKAYYNENFS